MFRLLFASGHGGSTREIKALCDLANVELILPGRATQKPLRHLATEEEAKRLGLRCFSTMEEIAKGEFDGWLVARPETIEGIREHFRLDSGKTIPIAARHSVNAFTKYARIGLQNFISPSRTALMKLKAPNSWLSVKVRDHDDLKRFAPKILPATQRKGFFSYIHHYKRYWKRAGEFFEQVQKQIGLAVPCENFGKDSAGGEVNDHKTMIKSKATLHIKDGQVCCNAPITSICLGIPVLMDYETLAKLGMEDYIVHNVSGLLFHTPEECVDAIRLLETEPDYLDELSQRTRAFARLKCTYSKNDVRAFRRFLHRMK